MSGACWTIRSPHDVYKQNLRRLRRGKSRNGQRNAPYSWDGSCRQCPGSGSDRQRTPDSRGPGVGDGPPLGAGRDEQCPALAGQICQIGKVDLLGRLMCRWREVGHPTQGNRCIRA